MPSWEDMEQDDPVASYYELCDQKGGKEENEDEDAT